ncbi:uncharacterized protein LOC110713021 [Chenopodium quinoa]|uniref:uncharacterized protein LOC110713021 n=1 Tax=Chenopodium quinoa TaxID=63459 RepID=UPI000B76C4B3|nr:uncharacterized protein LOC110713021 [Chenopodium quinoa]
MVGMTPTNQNFLIGYAVMKDETVASYRWVLEKLRNYIGPSVQPSAIVSDCEGGLFAPIAELFPESSHLLCTWHINKCVKVKAYNLFNKNLDSAERLVNGKWRKILQATTEAEYDRALDNFKDAYQWCPAIVDYVMQQWVPQREKFVKYWTNQVLHFGNTTTCRVESAHRALKDWIDSSTSALDTLFERINKAIDTQRNGIKNSLEDSRRRHGTMYSHFIFKILHGRVSHYCLGLILSEHTRMRELGDEVAIRCGCAISVTHGLPCACTIHRVITQDRASLHVDQVHTFWRTLVIGEHAVPQTVNREQEELEQFRSMFDQVSSSHPSVIRSATHVLHDMFNSSCLDHEEPEGVERPRGRQPRRERSAFEYIRGRGRTSSSSGSQTSSSVNMPGTGRMDIEHFPYKDRIPNIMMPFLDGWNDVVADGNCGFRVVADVFQMGEDNYGLVRQLMYSEIASNRAVYRHVYGQDLDRSLQRIRWGGGRCGQNHWFDAPLDLFAVANIYKCAVMHFGLGLHGRAYYPCTTVLPWCSRETVTRPVREVAIGFLGPSYRHFIRLDLSPDFPVPPIIPTWYTIRTASVEGWDALYHDRVQQWNNLVAFSM